MRTAACSAVFLLFFACPKRAPDFGQKGRPNSLAELLERTRATELSVKSLKGEGKLNVKSPRGSGSASIWVAVREPAQVNLQVMDFFGRPQAQLMTDGNRFGFYDGQAGKFFTGRATAANVARVLPLAVAPEDLAALLLGRVPQNTGEPSNGAWDETAGAFVVSIGEQSLQIQPPSYRVTRSRWPDRFDVQMSSIELIQNNYMPFEVELSHGDTRLSLKWQSVEPNAELEAELFEVSAPEGVPSIELGDQADRLNLGVPLQR